MTAQGPIIALDATYAAQRQPTGIGIYSQRLIGALGRIAATAGSRFPQVVLGFRPGPYVREARRHDWPPGFWTAPLFDKWLTWPRADLFHGLNQRLPDRHYTRTVVTLHERFPAPSDAYATAEFRSHMGTRIGRALQRADRIIAVSDSVREHLASHLPTLAGRIRVIHHGVDPAPPIDPQAPSRLMRTRLGLEPCLPYFLNVGAVQIRKNLKNLALALKSLPEVLLLIAGSDGYGAAEIRAFISQLGISGRVHFVGHLQPEDLQILYAGAVALVFPSLEEAFGMPVLEAMSCRCPVITSNVSALPEVAGDAALLIDPHSVEQLAEAMRRTLNEPDLAANLRARGAARAAEFSWDRCAMQTWRVYQELLG